ncbi:MAG: DMT family transporter [Candidatus Micrarchaeia archaeon]|jgi:drug/metabolite transporter (DMT)-like permease
MSLGVLAGAVTALVWGVSDFFSTRASRSAGPFRSLLYGLPIGIAIAASYSLLLERPQTLPAQALLVFAVSAFFNAVAWLAYMRALEKGKLSIADPVSGSYTILVVVLSFVFLGESLSLTQGIAVACAFFGVHLVSARHFGSAGAKILGSNEFFLALLAAFSWGISIFLLKTASATIQGGLSIAVSETMTLLFVAAYGAISRLDFSVPKPGQFKDIFPAHLLNASAMILLMAAFSVEKASIVAPISGTFPAFSVILAYAFLRERLEKIQLAGIILVIAALVLAAL